MSQNESLVSRDKTLIHPLWFPVHSPISLPLAAYMKFVVIFSQLLQRCLSLYLEGQTMMCSFVTYVYVNSKTCNVCIISPGFTNTGAVCRQPSTRFSLWPHSASEGRTVSGMLTKLFCYDMFLSCCLKLLPIFTEGTTQTILAYMYTRYINGSYC